MTGFLMVVVTGTLITALALFGIVLCITLCVGTYEVFTGEYKTQHEKILEAIKSEA